MATQNDQSDRHEYLTEYPINFIVAQRKLAKKKKIKGNLKMTDNFIKTNLIIAIIHIV